MKWIPTTRILADDFTKTLPPQKHKKFVRLIDLKNRQQNAEKWNVNEIASPSS